jgi:hypothetical protein
MKFIILISNLKEISSSVFSWKKEYIENYDAISQDFNIYPRNIHTQWTHSVKRLRMCEIIGWRKITWHKQKYWRILHENDTKRRIQEALCKN